MLQNVQHILLAVRPLSTAVNKSEEAICGIPDTAEQIYDPRSHIKNFTKRNSYAGDSTVVRNLAVQGLHIGVKHRRLLLRGDHSAVNDFRIFSHASVTHLTPRLGWSLF